MSEHDRESVEEVDDFAMINEADEGKPIAEDSQMELDKIRKMHAEKEKFLQNLKQKEKDDDRGDEDLSDDEEGKQYKRVKNLMKQAEYLTHFLLSRKTTKHNLQKKKKEGGGGKGSKHRHYSNREEEDELIREESQALDDNAEEVGGVTRLSAQPSILKGGTLKDYQLTGLNWMINLYENGLNGILADEMGLGKTIQTISIISFLKEYKRIHGPFLIIAPKSTLGNWFNEFKKWLPSARVIKLIALKEVREEILKNYIIPGKFDVVLTSNEGANICRQHLVRHHWKYVIIDEAHKMKNEESMFAKTVRAFKTDYKLLVTGTPLQNNLHELWSLLNFLFPEIFSSSEVFDEFFGLTSEGKAGGETSTVSKEAAEKRNMELIAQLHKILKPFMLRRTKDDVERSLPPKKEIHLYVGLTETQVEVYRKLLLTKTALDDKKFYLNTLMQLRKVCNHPYLFDGVEDPNLPILGSHIISVSGKMVIMDKLLTRLAKDKDKHQVLIFSQMSMMLNILEDYCLFKEYNYCRIDGDTDMDSRDSQIADFTTPGSDKFIFLLSTRAGGLGINLATADTVILYDSDWNPQVDLQAMDRAHRIGQKRQVNVYRLICEKTIEEKIIDRQMVKLKWDTLVIQKGSFVQQKGKTLTKDEMKEMIQFGASEIFRSNATVTDEELDVILARGEKKASELTAEIDSRVSKHRNLLDLAMNSLDIYTFDSVDYQQKKKEDEGAIMEAFLRQFEEGATSARTRRDKKGVPNYNLNEQFAAMIIKEPKKAPQVKVIKLPDFQFFKNKDRLVELLTKEATFLSKVPKSKTGAKKPPASASAMEIEKEGERSEDSQQLPEEKEADKETVFNGLTPQENAEKDKLLASGFSSWSKNEFNAFVSGCEKFGREDFDSISNRIGTKTPEEVEDYSKVFWDRIDELAEGQRFAKAIKRGEDLIQSRIAAQESLNFKCKGLKNPRMDIEFTPSIYTKSRSKLFSAEADKFLVYATWASGYGNWEDVKKMIKEDPFFRFDGYLKSRTEGDIAKRMQSLIHLIEKEKDAAEEVAKKAAELKEKKKKGKEFLMGSGGGASRGKSVGDGGSSNKRDRSDSARKSRRESKNGRDKSRGKSNGTSTRDGKNSKSSDSRRSHGDSSKTHKSKSSSKVKSKESEPVEKKSEANSNRKEPKENPEGATMLNSSSSKSKKPMVQKSLLDFNSGKKGEEGGEKKNSLKRDLIVIEDENRQDALAKAVGQESKRVKN